MDAKRRLQAVALGTVLTLWAGVTGVGVPEAGAAGGPHPTGGTASPQPAAAAAVTPKANARGVYLGKTDTAVQIGLATDNTSVDAYATNGSTVSAWYEGSLVGNSFDLAGPDGSRLAGAIIGGVAHGRYVTSAGAVTIFDTPAPKAVGTLFRGRVVIGSQVIEAGWIVQDDGTIKGGVSDTKPGSRTVSAAPAINPTKVRRNGTVSVLTGIPIPVGEVVPDGVTSPRPTAATGASLGNQAGHIPTKEDRLDRLEQPAVGERAPVTSAKPVHASMTVNPSTINVGGVAQVRITLTNTGATLQDAAFETAFPNGVALRHDVESLTRGTCKARSATTIDDTFVHPGDSQLLVRHLDMPAGASCVLNAMVIGRVAGRYEITTGRPRAPGRPDGAPATGVVTVTSPAATKAVAQRATTHAPAAEAAGPAPVATITAQLQGDVTLGASPLPVRLKLTSAPLTSWTIRFSDGSPEVSGTTAFPTFVPHTFVNFAAATAAPVVETAELTGQTADGDIGPLKVTVEVFPRAAPAKVKKAVVAARAVNGSFVRGTTSPATVEVVNLGDEDLKAGTVVQVGVAVPPGTATAALPQASLSGSPSAWDCGSPPSLACTAIGILGRYASPPPLTLSMTLAVEAPPTVSVTASLAAATADGTSVNANRTTVIPVDGVIANAGPDQAGVPSLTDDGTKLVRTQVRLDASKSTETQRQSSFTWTQTSGPTVTFADILPPADPTQARSAVTRFAVPIVSVPTTFGFHLVLTDGQSTDTDDVSVSVTPVNRPPVVKVDSGSIPKAPTGELLPTKKFKLTMKAKDPDNEAVTIGWEIHTPVPNNMVTIDGPTVTVKWPVASVPQLVLLATAVDPRGGRGADTVVIGHRPDPLTVAASGDAGALPGDLFSVHADTSVPASLQWTQISGPPVTIADDSAPTLDLLMPDDASVADAVVLEVTASAPGQVDATSRVAVAVLAAPPVLAALAVVPSQTVDPGDSGSVSAVAVGGQPTNINWTQISGTALTMSPNGLTLDFTAPATDTVAVVQVRATVGGVDVAATHAIVVGGGGSVCPAPPVALSTFPGIALPLGFTLQSATAAAACDGGAHLHAVANGPAGSTITLDGDRTAAGRLQATVSVVSLPVFGGTVSGSGTLDTAAGGRLSLTLTSPNLGIPLVTVNSAHLVLTPDGVEIQADGTIGVAGSGTGGAGRVAVNIAGRLADLDHFALEVTATGTGQWELGPGLGIDAGAIAGSIEKNGSAFTFAISAAFAGSWSPVAGVEITGVHVDVSNAAPPASCPGIGAGQPWVHVGGTGTLDAGITEDPIGLAVDGCLGLPGTGAHPVFVVTSTATFPNWQPIAGFDLFVNDVSLTISYNSDDELALTLEGDADVLGISIHALARVQFVSGQPEFLVLATGDLSPLHLPITSGTIALSSAPVPAGEIDGIDVDLPAGLTVVAGFTLPASVFTQLHTNAGLPISSPTVTLLANLGNATITLEAIIPTGNFPLLVTCKDGFGTAACGITDPGTTAVTLSSIALRLQLGSGGPQIAVAANGTLFLPGQDHVSQDQIGVGVSVFVAPPATVGMSMYIQGEWNNALGIPGANVQAAALQASIDFSVPAAPVPSVGVLLALKGLPTALNSLLHVQDPVTHPETVRLAANISATAPIFELTLGDHDGHTFLKPVDQLAIDDASIVIAPRGGALGPFQYTPGLHLSFGATVFQVPINAMFDLDLPNLVVDGTLSVGRVVIGPLTVDGATIQAHMEVGKLAVRVKGSAKLDRNGPAIAIDACAVVGTRPPAFPAASCPASTVGLHVRGAVANWPLAPGVTLSTVTVVGDVTLTPPSLTMTISTAVVIMGASRTMAGTVTFADGELQKLQVALLPGSLSIGGVTIGGDGTCPARVTLSPAGTGPCIAVDYDRSLTPSLQAMVRGTVVAGGASAKFDGILDATHAEVSATATVPALGTVALDGVLFFGTNPDARILDQNGATVAALNGDFRLSGRLATAKSLGTVSAKWGVTIGRASSTSTSLYLLGNADVNLFGVDAHLEGTFSVSGTTLTYHVTGTADGQIDLARRALVTTGDRLAAFTAAQLADSASVTHALTESGLKLDLAGRATFHFEFDASSSGGLTVDVNGNANLFYVERPNSNDEARSAWTTLVGLSVDFDSSTGEFCYSATLGVTEFNFPLGC